MNVSLGHVTADEPMANLGSHFPRPVPQCFSWFDKSHLANIDHTHNIPFAIAKISLTSFQIITYHAKHLSICFHMAEYEKVSELSIWVLVIKQINDLALPGPIVGWASCVLSVDYCLMYTFFVHIYIFSKLNNIR